MVELIVGILGAVRCFEEATQPKRREELAEQKRAEYQKLHPIEKRDRAVYQAFL